MGKCTERNRGRVSIFLIWASGKKGHQNSEVKSENIKKHGKKGGIQNQGLRGVTYKWT